MYTYEWANFLAWRDAQDRRYIVEEVVIRNGVLFLELIEKISHGMAQGIQLNDHQFRVIERNGKHERWFPSRDSADSAIEHINWIEHESRK